MSVSKLSIQLGLGFAAIGGVGGGFTYVLLNNNSEYLVEVRWEDETDSYIHEIHEENSSIDSMPHTLDEIKGGKDKNYFCQWIDVTAKVQKDEQCKLINLDFDGAKSLNLAQIANMNNEITETTKYFPEIWFKLKISKNYVFDINNTTQISIVDKDINSKIFTTLMPRFKISASPIQGNVDLFLTKLVELNTTNLNISDDRNYQCRWVTKDELHEISSSFKKSASILIDHNFQLIDCYIDEFVSSQINTTQNEKIKELDFTYIERISTPITEITHEKKSNYFLIKLEEVENHSTTKSISDLLKKDHDLIVVYLETMDENKIIPFATFTVDLPLTMARSNIDSSRWPYHLILLN